MKRFFFALTVSIVGLSTIAHAEDGSWHLIMWNKETAGGMHKALVSDSGAATQGECLVLLGKLSTLPVFRNDPGTCVFVPEVGQ